MFLQISFHNKKKSLTYIIHCKVESFLPQPDRLFLFVGVSSEGGTRYIEFHCAPVPFPHDLHYNVILPLTDTPCKILSLTAKKISLNISTSAGLFLSLVYYFNQVSCIFTTKHTYAYQMSPSIRLRFFCFENHDKCSCFQNPH